MPQIKVNKLFGASEGSSSSGTDPAEESLQAAKEFTNSQKKRLRDENTGITADTTEENWEDEGGAISSIPKEITEQEKNERFVALTMTAPAYYDEHPIYRIYTKIWLEIRELRNKKGKDYGTPEDPFANIRGSKDFGVKAWVGAAKSADDCLVRIAKYAREGHLENDSIRDVMLDLANYAIIMATLWEEEQKTNGK